MHVPMYEFGGSGPALHLAGANGFPPQTYEPVFQPLTTQYRVVSLLPRPLWRMPPPPEQLLHWRQMAGDLLAGLRALDLSDVIAVGHSMGGVFSILAALEEPERFRALVLLDPTLLAPHLLLAVRAMRAVGLESRLPLVQGALRRRAEFESIEAAYEYWRGKPLFAGWPDETVRLYAESMTRPDGEGEGVALAWPREWESRVYQTVPADVWEHVGRLDGLLPVLVVRGSETDTFGEASARKFGELVPRADMIVVEGHGHLFPHSAPDETRGIIRGWLAGL